VLFAQRAKRLNDIGICRGAVLRQGAWDEAEELFAPLCGTGFASRLKVRPAPRTLPCGL